MGIRVFISGNSGNKEVSEITSTTLRPRYSWVFQLWWDLLKVKFWYDFMAKIDYWKCFFDMAPRTFFGKSSTMRRRRGVLQSFSCVISMTTIFKRQLGSYFLYIFGAKIQLKITEKVSFNIASEVSYVYILNGQKSIENAKNCPFWRVFENLQLAIKQCYQTGQF